MKIHGTACDWTTAKIDESVKNSDSCHVFAYGSLLWNPGFPIISATPAKLRGYKRRFWNKSADHRGTAEFCGLVVCLVDAGPLDEVHGVLYEFDSNLRHEVITLLDIREKYGYIRRIASGLHPISGDHIAECFAYCACTSDESIDVFLHPSNGVDNTLEEIVVMAQIINKAIGPSGSNMEYLQKLKQSLTDLGIVDDHVDSLLHQCKTTAC